MSDFFNKDLIRYGRAELGRLAGSVALGLAGAALTVLQATLLAGVITRVFLEGKGLTDVEPALLWLLGVFAGRTAAAFLGDLLAHQAALRLKERLREQIYAAVQDRGPAYTRGERTGELTNLVQAGVETLDAYYRQYLPAIALAGLAPLLVLAAVLSLDLLSGAILLVTAPLIPFFMVLIGKTAERLTRRQWTALNRLSAHFLDTLQGLNTLKLLGRSRAHTASIAAAGERYRAVTMEVLRLTFLSALALELLATISTAIVAVQIGLRLLEGGISYEAALTILILAPEVYLPLRTLGLRFHAGAGALPVSRALAGVLGAPSGGPSILPPQSAAATGPGFSRIEFDRVSYCYPDSQLPALADLSFSIEAGTQLALVGPSGAGKSTLLALLLRFVEPTGGEIRVDGRPLSQIPADAWRELLAWVPQQPYLFQGTLAENIRLARPHASLEELQTAASQARLLDWVGNLPAGWDTPVGEGGSLVSGGQAQRIALARAFLKDAPLLLLDEPTAHLDRRLEEDLRQATAALLHGRTAITIAHRLSTVRQTGRVLVLEGGRLVESGRPADLLTGGGLFARLAGAGGGGWLESAGSPEPGGVHG